MKKIEKRRKFLDKKDFKDQTITVTLVSADIVQRTSKDGKKKYQCYSLDINKDGDIFSIDMFDLNGLIDAWGDDADLWENKKIKMSVVENGTYLDWKIESAEQ